MGHAQACLLLFGGQSEPPRANGANRGSHFASKAMGARSREPRAKIFALGETPLFAILHSHGDRRFLRDVTLKTIQNVEQKSRKTPPLIPHSQTQPRAMLGAVLLDQLFSLFNIYLDRRDARLEESNRLREVDILGGGNDRLGRVNVLSSCKRSVVLAFLPSATSTPRGDTRTFR